MVSRPSEQAIVITGAAGFIGTHLCNYYLQQGWNVYGIDNLVCGSQKNVSYLHDLYPDLYTFIEKDVCDNWLDFSEKPIKYIFHLASPTSVKSYQNYPLKTLWANSIGLNNAINLADQHQARLIFASTSEIYGSPLSSPQKESDWGHVNPFGERSCYDEAKRFGEALIFSHNKVHGTNHGLVRIFNTYGPRMHENDDRVVNTFVKQALKNEDLVAYGDGSQTRSFCYIDDLIAGLVAYADSDLSIPVNLGNDEEISIAALARMVIDFTASKSKIRYEPLPADDPPQRRPDLTLARQFLGFSPAHSLQTGLKKLITDNIP